MGFQLNLPPLHFDTVPLNVTYMTVGWRERVDGEEMNVCDDEDDDGGGGCGDDWWWMAVVVVVMVGACSLDKLIKLNKQIKYTFNSSTVIIILNYMLIYIKKM